MTKNKYNILIVPAGSGMAIAAHHALKEHNEFNIIGADSDRLAAGLYICKNGYVIPPIDDKDFFSSIKRIVSKENIHAIFPTHDYFLLEFAKRKKEFEKMGAKIIISEHSTVKICRDKWLTMNKLKGKIPLPYSSISLEDITSFPVFIKPRDGSGSKYAYKINSKKELDELFYKVPNPIIQEFLPGREYSVDCLCGLDSKLLACIPQDRIGSKSGIATQGKLVKNERLEEIAQTISECIPFKGPFFFQAIEDRQGIPKLTEINPRIAGIMSLASNSGINIHALAVKLFMGEDISIPQKRTGLYLTRYYEDIFLSESDLKEMI